MAARYETFVDNDADRVSLAPGIAAPNLIRLKAWDHDGFDISAEVVAIGRTADRLGRFECRKLCIEQREGGPAVSGDQMRKTAIAGLVRSAAGRWWEDVTANLETGEISFAHLTLTDEILSRLKAAGPSDPETRAWVARIYRVALVLGDAPTLAVERAFQIPRSTASWWISAARKGGALGPSEGRGRAAG